MAVPAARRRLTDQDRYLRSIPEAAFQTRVIETARTFGWLCHHTRPALRQGGRYSTPIQGAAGFPDLVLAKNGRVIFAELKTETGRLTDWQEQWIQALTSDPLNAPEVFVWRPSDYEEEICKVLAA